MTNTKRDVLIIGDPWPTLDHARDSSLHLARVAKRDFGITSHWALPENVFLMNGVLFALTEGIVSDATLVPQPQNRELSSFHSVHWRTDPPVDLATMRLWSLLAASGGERGVPFVNAPHALLTWNEKFAPLRFRNWCIPGMVSDSEHAWKNFFESFKGRAAQLVAKPSGDAASRGVQLLPATWDEAQPKLRALREEHGPWLVLQEYDSSLQTLGETRVFILNSEVVGAINKRAHPKHKIMSLDLPPEERPTLSATDLTSEQNRRATDVAAALAHEGVYIATIDFIGERILEINVTSPGLIAWLDERLPESRQIARRYWQGLISLA